MRPLTVSTIDYHTGGEPFRIVSGGTKPLQGATILDKRRYASEHLDDIRKLVILEPRGHADMYGCFVTDPADDDGDLGVVFFHNAGYSTACGHGTIALVTWAIETGVVAITGNEATVVVDVPSGRLETVARVEEGRVQSVRFTNVPSFVHSEGVVVPTSAGELITDISYGGAFYASVHAPDVGLGVQPSDLTALIELGREIKLAIEKDHEIVHPVEPELRDIYGVVFYESHGAPGDFSQRNVTIFADGEVDRSPCGSGTSARLALLDKSGVLPRGQTLVHRSIVDSVFHASVTGDAFVAEIPAVITEVEGRAHLCGFHHFVLDPADPLGTGFLLR
jgi:proline racemase